MRRSLVLTSLIAFMGCKNREFNAESNTTSATSDRTEAAAKAISGCYQGTMEQGATGQFLLKTKRVCVEYTPDSRSGALTFNFFGADAKLINSLGVNLASDQPRCPGCYAFEGLESKINYSSSGLQQMSLSLVEKYPPKGTYTWTLVREIAQ